MIDKKISVSEQVANLPLAAQLIFTWSVPHSDDLGLLPISHRTLKALIIPMMDISLEDFGNQVEHIVSQGLWEIFTHGKDRYYRQVSFFSHQTLKKDRKPNTYLVDIESWSDVESLGFQMEDNGNPSKEKRREEKRTEEKIDKEIVASAPTPKQTASKFFEVVLKKNSEFDELVQTIATNSRASPDLVSREIIKFASYWTELNLTGKKQKWEMQSTFEVKRRLSTWFGNVKSFSGTKENISRFIPAIV